MGTADGVARRIGRLAETLRIGVRTLTSVDTNPVPAGWEHITKVDPEDGKELPLLYPLYLQHTSAVSVGGSRDVNSRNTEETFALLDRADVPVFHEPSAARHVTERTRESAEFLAIPEVLNGDAEAMVGTLGEGTEYLREELMPEMLDEKAGWLPSRARRRLVEFATSWFLSRSVFEAYIIQNPDSAAAREANVTGADLLSPGEAARRALAAERHLESEVIYVEYSGTFGGEEGVALLEAVDDAVSWSRIWYGGGVDSRERARAVLDAGADVVIVGNAFHEVAAEERELCGDAVDDLPADADPTAVEGWIDEHVDVPGTDAARYLSTIPSVDDPGRTARAYLTATVETRLALERLAGGIDGDDGPAIVEAVFDRPPDALPGVAHLEGTLADGSAADFARALAVAFLTDRRGVAADPGLPIDHLGLR